MSFADPSQHHHKLAGMKRALATKDTPAHLKPHLERQVARLEGTMRNVKGARVGQRGSTGMGGLPPAKAIVRAVDQNDRLNTANPYDEESFTDNSNNQAIPEPGRVNPNAAALAAGSASPNQYAPSQQARGMQRTERGPGIHPNETAVRKLPSAPGLNRTLGAVRRPDTSRRGPGLLPRGPNVARAGQRGEGIKAGLSPSKTDRWQRKGSANPAFYGDWGL